MTNPLMTLNGVNKSFAGQHVLQISTCNLIKAKLPRLLGPMGLVNQHWYGLFWDYCNQTLAL